MVCEKPLLELTNRFLTTEKVTKISRILNSDVLSMTNEKISEKSENILKEFPSDFEETKLLSKCLTFKNGLVNLEKLLEYLAKTNR